MEFVKELVMWIIANYQLAITAVVTVLTGLIALFLLIPGEQPEKTLQKIVDFLSKFSIKK
jgi:hypothetical protein